MLATRTAVAVAALIAALSATQAVAAPQALGVVATDEALPMQCVDGECTTILSAFCLQKDRKPPAHGTAYLPVDNDALTVVVRSRAGETIRLPSEGLVRFATYRGYNAIKASLDETRLAALDPVAVSVEVGPRATMTAVPRADDTDPMSEEEVALITGPLRAAGEAIFERAGEKPDAARLIGAAVNIVSADDDTVAAAGPETWRKVAARGAGLSDAGVVKARSLFQGCRRQVAHSTGFTMRTCLEMRHRWLMRDINTTYWKAVEGGV